MTLSTAYPPRAIFKSADLNELVFTAKNPNLSNPPTGGYKVTNIYVNSNGKLVIEYDTGE